MIESVVTIDLIVDWIELPYLSILKPAFSVQIYFRCPKAARINMAFCEEISFPSRYLAFTSKSKNLFKLHLKDYDVTTVLLQDIS